MLALHMRFRCDNRIMAFARAKTKLMDEASLHEYAVGALGRRMRSVAEMRRLLRNRVEIDTELGQALVDLVIVRLKDSGYLNDTSYATAFSSYRRDNEKFGRRRIEKTVGEVFEEVNEEKQAREYLRRKRIKKPEDQKQAARIFRGLMRAGFGPKTIFTILKKWDVEEEVLTTLESEETTE